MQAQIRSSPMDSTVLNVTRKNTVPLQAGDCFIPRQKEYTDIRTRRQGIRLVELRRQRVTSREPHTSKVAPSLKESGQLRGNIHSPR